MKPRRGSGRRSQSPAIARGMGFIIPTQKREGGRQSWRNGFHTLHTNTSPLQEPARIFNLLDARNLAVVAFLLFNLHKSRPFEQGNERINIIHPFVGMKILPSAIYTV